MNTYTDFQALAQTRKRKIDNHTYLVIREDGGYGVRLHETEVVIHYPDRVVLDSGGWQTATTKDRINKYSTIRIHQEKGIWYANNLPYADGITFWANGSVTGQGTDPRATIKLRRQVNQYAKEYAKEFTAGHVPAPSSGDCWYCSMFPGNHSEHIQAHIEEKYYVPSMLKHVKDRLAPITQDYIARTWQHDPDVSEWQQGIAAEQIAKGIRHYCLEQLELPR